VAMLEAMIRDVELTIRMVVRKRFGSCRKYAMTRPTPPRSSSERTVAALSELLKRRYSTQLDQQANEYIDLIVAAATRMKYVRRYADAAGGSHFEDVETALRLVEFAVVQLPDERRETSS